DLGVELVQRAPCGSARAPCPPRGRQGRRSSRATEEERRLDLPGTVRREIRRKKRWRPRGASSRAKLAKSRSLRSRIPVRGLESGFESGLIRRGVSVAEQLLSSETATSRLVIGSHETCLRKSRPLVQNVERWRPDEALRAAHEDLPALCATRRAAAYRWLATGSPCWRALLRCGWPRRRSRQRVYPG